MKGYSIRPSTLGQAVPPDQTSRRIGMPAVNSQLMLFATALALWMCAAVALFAQNRLILAFWFVLTHLLLPLTIFLSGWMCHTIISRSSHLSVAKLIRLHLSILVFASLALPIVLGVVNLLPVGQTTAPWQGDITAYGQLISPWGITASTVSVTSESLGPRLRFKISSDEYYTIAEAKALGLPLRVEGSVVRGFTGVPVTVRLKPFRPSPTPAK